MTANRKRFYTLAEYIELEKSSDERYEYWNGEIFLMSGASPEHAQIESNVIRSLGNQLEDRDCSVLASSIRIKVPATSPYRYADITVVCGKAEYEKIEGLKVLVNPIVLIEVLSDSTEKFDRTKKFSFYQSIPSFKEYLLIDQNEPCITQWVKQEDGDWQPHEVTDLKESLYLPSINCTLELSTVYRRVL